MFATLRATLVTKIVDHLCDIQAKALVHLVQPVIVQVAAELREAVVSGRGMTNDEVEARVAELLKPLLEAEEEAVGTHIQQMVAASTRTPIKTDNLAPARTPEQQQAQPDPAAGPTPKEFVRAGYAPKAYPPKGYAAKLNDGTPIKDGDAEGLKQAKDEAVAERVAMDEEKATQPQS